MADRAVLFIDGNNWYHGLGDAGVTRRAERDYRRISEKLVEPRHWVGTRYYIGRMDQRWSRQAYAAQRSFLARLLRDDPQRITHHLGRLERRRVGSRVARELLDYLATLSVRIDRTVYHELLALGRQSRTTEVLVEKAVDVMLAVDLVVMAEREEYDAAYLLSADGDFTPAVCAAKAKGKKVYSVAPLPGAQLARACDSSVRVPKNWFDDCYRSK